MGLFRMMKARRQRARRKRRAAAIVMRAFTVAQAWGVKMDSAVDRLDAKETSRILRHIRRITRVTLLAAAETRR